MDSSPARRPALDTDPRDVGRRVRALREARGLSLSELARRAGVGKATLSGLENGTRNPTLETLWAVTAQLGVPMTAILVEAGPGAPEPAAVPVMHGTAVAATLLEVFDDGDVTYELYRLDLPAGTEQVSPAHHAGVTEHLTVFAGTLRAGPLDAPLTGGPGDHLSWRSDVPHGYAAPGPDDVRATLLIRYPRP
ncbi:transcriptional regulator [Actinomadura craniellae]|uniref:Transcriptional regulator n=1 Tax=Actinomadura craniellae TaxID=2231787 RepID=A0A365H0J8_9ACTN|nr:XRE family transcriptional regulator [Actinomadura craniellae]RAY11723.1 transcriptional regulator [Actinomadura craniellae]